MGAVLLDSDRRGRPFVSALSYLVRPRPDTVCSSIPTSVSSWESLGLYLLPMKVLQRGREKEGEAVLTCNGDSRLPGMHV